MKRLLSLIMVLLMMVLSSCGKQEEIIKEKDVLRFGLLNGPTGIGASYLLEKNENDEIAYRHNSCDHFIHTVTDTGNVTYNA